MPKYQVRKGRQDESLGKGRMPQWKNLSQQQKANLIHAIVMSIAEWKPMEPKLLEPLPKQLLSRLLEAIQEIKANGLAGPQFRAADRIKVLKRKLAARGLLPSNSEPTPDQVLNQQPVLMQQQVRAHEAMQVKASEHNAEQAMLRMLAGTL